MSGSERSALVVVGLMGSIEEVNDEACALLGYSRDELLRMHGSELVSLEDQPRVATSIDRMRRGELVRREGRLVRKDGSVVRVQVEGRALPGGRVAMSVTAAPAGDRG